MLLRFLILIPMAMAPITDAAPNPQLQQQNEGYYDYYQWPCYYQDYYDYCPYQIFPDCCDYNCAPECYPSHFPTAKPPEPIEDKCTFSIPGWFEIQGRHIYLGQMEAQLSRFEAEAKAVEVGGNLWEIRSDDDKRILDAISNCYDSCARIWLGGDDLASPGNWVWSSDLSSISNLNFANDGNDNGHCIDVELCGNYQWHKVKCGGMEREHAFIAEKLEEVEPTTRPPITTIATTTTTTKPIYITSSQRAPPTPSK